MLRDALQFINGAPKSPHPGGILLSQEATAVPAERSVATERLGSIWIPCLSVPRGQNFQLRGGIKLKDCHMIHKPLASTSHTLSIPATRKAG